MKGYSKFKKIMSVTVMMTVLALGIAGCSAKSTPSESASEKPAATEQAEETKAADTRLAKIQEAGVLKVIMEPYFAPYEFIDSSKAGQDQYRGADVELAKYIAKKLDVELEIVPLEWTAVLTGISTGKYDMAISGMGYTAERAEAMDLSNAYRETVSEHGFVVKADTVDDFPELSSLFGKKIGFQKGTLQEMFTNDQIEDVKGQPFDSVQNAILALQSGKVDAVAVSYDNGELFCEANPDLVMAKPLFAGTKDQTVVACPKGSTALMEEVNTAIAEVVEGDLYTGWWEEANEEAKTLGVSQ